VPPSPTLRKNAEDGGLGDRFTDGAADRLPYGVGNAVRHSIFVGHACPEALAGRKNVCLDRPAKTGEPELCAHTSIRRSDDLRLKNSDYVEKTFTGTQSVAQIEYIFPTEWGIYSSDVFLTRS